MTRLEKPVQREFNMRDIGNVVLTMNGQGVEIRVKGTKRAVGITWDAIIQSGALSKKAPAKLYGANSLMGGDLRRKWLRTGQ